MNKKQLITGLIVLVALIALFLWVRQRVHFDFGVFRSQLAMAQWGRIAIALACIYVAYIFRSIRWALLMRHNRKVPVFSLIGTQVIGFTAVALIGRVADLVRPYLVAKKTGTELSSQIAVYIVERLFDFGSMGLIFSVAILGLPHDAVVQAIRHSNHLGSLSHNHPDAAAFFFRYGGLVLTFLGAMFLVVIRLSGEMIATVSEHTIGLVSKKLGTAIGHKIRTFHTGLDTIRTFGDLASTTVLSVLMWVLIATSYIQTMRAFVASPPLADITAAQGVLLMVVSGGASIIQLPVLGWFSQIGIVAAAITGFYGAAPEASTACAASLLLVTFLGIIPVGLVWAQFENVNLRRITVESEHAGEELTDQARALD